MPFRVIVIGGEITFTSPRAAFTWRAWLDGHEGAHLVIQEEKPTRSLSQNAYYWTYLGIVDRETGQSATDVHEWAKRKFLPPRFITVNGEEMKIPGSTTELDKVAFGEYLDKLSAEIDIALPNPEDAGYISNY
jgi:hypothetical protein